MVLISHQRWQPPLMRKTGHYHHNLPTASLVLVDEILQRAAVDPPSFQSVNYLVRPLKTPQVQSGAGPIVPCNWTSVRLDSLAVSAAGHLNDLIHLSTHLLACNFESTPTILPPQPEDVPYFWP